MRTRRSLDETRGQILAAAVDLIEERGYSLETAHVPLIDACRRAGLGTAGSGYKIWPTQQAFRDDLLRHLFECVDVDVMMSAEMMDALDAARPEADRRELIRVGSNERARVVSESSAFTRAVALWLAAEGDPGLTENYRDALRAAVDRLAGMYRNLMDHFDVEMVPPFTVELFALAVISQAYGLGIHDAVVDDLGAADIERPTGAKEATQAWHLLGCVTEALAVVYTRRRKH